MTAQSTTITMMMALAVAMVPAAAMAQDPNEYEAGVTARLAGNPAEARILLEKWLAEHPDDVDAELQLAYANLAIGRLDAAEEGFRAVLAAAPDYADARAGLKEIRKRHVENINARVALEGALSDLSGSAAGWSEAALDVEAPVGNSTIGGRVSHYRRFGVEDIELGIRIGLHPSENLWLRAHAGATPKADFRPKLEIGGGIDARLSGSQHTVVTFEAAYQQFPLQDVVTINPGLVQYFGNGRTWLTLRGIGTLADTGPLEVGGLVRVDHTPSDRWQIFAGAANGPDTDLGVVSRTSALFGGVKAPLGNALSVGGSISQEWRDLGSDRTEFRLTLSARL